MFRLFCIALLLLTAGAAQALPTALLGSLSWRFVGPYRGGRVDAVAGIPGKLNVAYFGSVDGGVFKTTDAGVTWEPLFQHQLVGSIGAIAVAPSNPKIIYVGTGESTIRTGGTYGAGVYRSDDGGQTWHYAGLYQTRHIGRLLVDPTNPDDVLVAALGHVWSANGNTERGVFLTTDGGAHWKKTLYVNPQVGAVDLARDPAHPDSIYATTWNAVRPPWFQYGPINGPGSAIYHSGDGGQTWQKLGMQGLPASMGRIGITVADTSSGPRLYAIVTAGEMAIGANSAGKGSGVYRSDDGGKTWKLVNDADRISGRGWYFSRIYADPKNPDIVYVPNTSLYRSTDGGVHFTAIKGSPDGDDMHCLWIDPSDPAHMIVGSDQGTGISLNDGATWSSWFNQPIAQIYHLSVDDQTPYNIYATQQDSGALVIASRGRSGIITNEDWQPTAGGGESGYMFPRKGDPTIIYGSSAGGTIGTYNLKTLTSTDISPQPPRPFGAPPDAAGYYAPWNTPLAPSPFDANTLYAGTRVVYETQDAGKHWKAISPTLTGYQPKGTDCSGTPTQATASACGYSVVYAIGVSPVKRGVLWAGTDDGHLWVTQDGGAHWQSVMPPNLGPWSRVDTIATDPHDAGTAYVAIDRHRVDDLAPYIYITHDFGKTWTKAVNGIPYGDYVAVVRPDPDRKGLLYAGTEQGIFVSFNDGTDWQSLQLNLPTSSVRDLRVHDNDLIVGTHGRGIWILDDIAPLRQGSEQVAASSAYLYAPPPAVLFSLGIYNGEARPPEVPHAANPPTGAIIDYWLGKDVQGPVTLSVYDAKGKLVRHYSSADKPAEMPPADYPDYFLSPPTVLSAKPGANRFVWDLRATPPAGAPHWAGPAVLHRTPRGPLGSLVSPGKYRVVLTVDGKDYSQELTVSPNPYGYVPPTHGFGGKT